MRRTLTALAAVGLTAGSLSLAGPARAVPPVTPDQMVAAVTAAQIAAMQALTTIGGKSVCSVISGADSHTFTVISRSTGVSFRHESTGESQFFAATSKRVWAPVESVQYVDATTKQPVLASAHAPKGSKYVKGPMGATAIRYLPSWQYADLPAWRSTLIGSFAIGMLPDWVTGPGVSITELPLAGGAVQWRAFRTIDPTHTTLLAYDIDSSGRDVAMRNIEYTNDVATTDTSCSITGYGSPPPIGIPPKSITASLSAVGLAAWRLHWTTTLATEAKKVVAAVIGAKTFTAVAIRQQAQVTIQTDQLQNDVTVGAVPNGARMQVQDTQGHTVARCVTVKGGIVATAPC